MIHDIAVIGAGPAGIAASIYLKRAGFEALVFEKGEIGGLLLNANLVENYPGFPEGIGGKALVELFKVQLSSLGIVVKNSEVKKIVVDDDLLRLITNEDEISVRVAIVATGTVPKTIGIQGESSLIGRKLFYEIKDIPQGRTGDTFMIIGGGDAAFDYALNLSEDAARVDIIYRSETPKCLSLLEERVRKMENVYVHPKTLPSGVYEQENVIKIKTISEEKEVVFTSDYVILAAGRMPNLNILPEKMRESLTIKEDGSTDIPGLFMAGDVRRGLFRQTGIAVGDGILCAMSAVNFLKGDERE